MERIDTEKKINRRNKLLRSRADGVSYGKFFCEPFIPAASCKVFWFKNKTVLRATLSAMLLLHPHPDIPLQENTTYQPNRIEIIPQDFNAPFTEIEVGKTIDLSKHVKNEEKVTPRIPYSRIDAEEFAKETASITGSFSSGDILNSLQNASALVVCAIHVETPSLNPYAIGAELELGPGQLHPRGKLPRFYKDGYTNPFDPIQVVAFMEDQFAKGDARHWAGPRDGKC